MSLHWPKELAGNNDPPSWQQAQSNVCLDFHGDPRNCNCVVFSDGNHHMALQETLSEFCLLHPAANIFYATTPPNVLLSLIDQGRLAMGNLVLSLQPHIFIGPEASLKKLQSLDKIISYEPFMKSQGVALLVKKNNPLSILSLSDLLRKDVILAISNPEQEPASYEVYQQSLVKLAQASGLVAEKFLQHLSLARNVVFSQRIHHREIPEIIHLGQAHVALLYYHLALRFSRIFPQEFDMIPLGSKHDPGVKQHSICTTYYAGKLNQAGAWGEKLVEFLASDKVSKIYQNHGLNRP